MTNIVKNAIAERKKLESALSDNPIVKKIKLLNEIISNFSKTPKEKRGKLTKKDQIHQLAQACMKENGGHAKLGTIHEYLTNHKVPVHIGMLKSYMYKYKDFKPSRSKGFSIRK